MAPLGWAQRFADLRWIFLRRDDLLGQAISLVIAKQTGRWRSTATAGGTARYDAHAIREEMADIARSDARWRTFFAQHGIQPLELTYERVTAASQAAVDAVAALLGLAEPARIDLSQVDVAVQRDEGNREWRARFLAEPSTMHRAPVLRAVRSPRLTVGILTRDSEPRLPRLLAEAAEYADEIIVGVDAASTDRTLEIATAMADTVYRFRLQRPGQLAPARMLAFDYATGDWILTLDDDEGMDPSFDALAGELMSAARVTHYYFPRKWVVAATPYAYVHAPPWYPNWAPRLLRNDRSLVWKPARPHSMYHLQGPGHYEERTSILHFEPLLCPPERRTEKVGWYRDAGATDASESFYLIPLDTPRRPVTLRVDTIPAPRAAPAAVDERIHELIAAEMPPWGSEFVEVAMPAVVSVTERPVVEVTVRNTGALAWSPTYAQFPANAWPLLRLTYHLRSADGTVLDWTDRERTLLPRFVAPGERVTFLHELVPPEAPGDYILEWDLVSEFDVWFSQCGNAVHRSALTVRAG